MKGEQSSGRSRAEVAVSRGLPMKLAPESSGSRDASTRSSAEENQTRTSNLVLLFLDLSRVTGDATYLAMAVAGAKHLAKAWKGPSTRPPIIRGLAELSSVRSLSLVSLALTQTWKATKNPVYRDAGLNIIRYLAKTAPTVNRLLTAVRRGER